MPEGDLWPRVQAHWLIGLGRRDIEDERERDCPEVLVHHGVLKERLSKWSI